eukprot:1997527-Rhodomonas_salina.1
MLRHVLTCGVMGSAGTAAARRADQPFGHGVVCVAGAIPGQVPCDRGARVAFAGFHERRVLQHHPPHAQAQVR